MNFHFLNLRQNFQIIRHFHFLNLDPYIQKKDKCYLDLNFYLNLHCHGRNWAPLVHKLFLVHINFILNRVLNSWKRKQFGIFAHFNTFTRFQAKVYFAFYHFLKCKNLRLRLKLLSLFYYFRHFLYSHLIRLYFITFLSNRYLFQIKPTFSCPHRNKDQLFFFFFNLTAIFLHFQLHFL